MSQTEKSFTYYRKGLGLKAEVQDTLAADYTGQLVDLLRERDFALEVGDTTVRLAREFGFCYGVERAVDYAYQTRRKFPGPAHLPGGRDHPQPARERQAAGAWASTFLTPDRARASTTRRVSPNDVVHPAGIRRHHSATSRRCASWAA